MVPLRFALLALAAYAASAHAVLTEVVVDGVEGEVRENVRKRLGIVEVIGDAGVPDSHVAWLHGRAPAQIREAMEPFGYYDVQVEADLEDAAGGLRAFYRIAPGAPVTVNSVDVGLSGPGSDDDELVRAVDDFPLGRDDVLNHRRYEAGKSEIERLLSERGYFDASLTAHVVRVDVNAGTAEIELHWQTGPRYRFGPAQFDGSQFPDSFMERFMNFERGEAFRQSTLLELQRALIDTDYFAQVDVNALREEAEDLAVPVRITVTPRKRDVYSAGVGFGTDTGARVEGGYQRRWLNRRGHRFRTNIEIGERRQGLNTQYGIPVHRDNVRQYTVGARYLEEETESVDRRGTELSLGREATWFGWQQIISLNLLVERFELGSEEVREESRDTQDATMLYPQLRLSRTRANDPVVPTRGWRLEGYLRAGHESLLSDTSFMQLGASARWIVPGLGRDRILLRGEAATSWVEDFDRMPASLRFYAGGDRNLRGYEYQELGPVDEDGEVIGGEHLLVASAEYEHMFLDKWGAAVFVDAGNAFSGTDFDPEVGTGVGLRWRSPVGMVRVDVAAAVTQPGDPLQFHLVIGPDL